MSLKSSRSQASRMPRWRISDGAEVREFKQRWHANGMAKLLKRMVARDGIEPPTPAFSVCDYPSRSTTCGSRTAAYVLPNTWKSGRLWVALWVEFSESQP